MAKTVNISAKLTDAKPQITIGDKSYPIDNSVELVFKFEELQAVGTFSALLEAFTSMLGEDVVEELGLRKWSIDNIKVLTIGIMAAIQDVDYEVAEGRFRG